MPRFLVRFVSVLVIGCLLVDTNIASAVSRPLYSNRHLDISQIQEQALAAVPLDGSWMKILHHLPNPYQRLRTLEFVNATGLVLGGAAWWLFGPATPTVFAADGRSPLIALPIVLVSMLPMLAGPVIVGALMYGMAAIQPFNPNIAVSLRKPYNKKQFERYLSELNQRKAVSIATESERFLVLMHHWFDRLRIDVFEITDKGMTFVGYEDANIHAGRSICNMGTLMRTEEIALVTRLAQAQGYELTQIKEAIQSAAAFHMEHMNLGFFVNEKYRKRELGRFIHATLMGILYINQIDTLKMTSLKPLEFHKEFMNDEDGFSDPTNRVYRTDRYFAFLNFRNPPPLPPSHRSRTKMSEQVADVITQALPIDFALAGVNGWKALLQARETHKELSDRPIQNWWELSLHASPRREKFEAAIRDGRLRIRPVEVHAHALLLLQKATRDQLTGLLQKALPQLTEHQMKILVNRILRIQPGLRDLLTLHFVTGFRDESRLYHFLNALYTFAHNDKINSNGRNILATCS